MNVWRLHRGYDARLALAGVMIGVCALIASPAPLSAAPKWFACTPIDAAVFPGSRIQIICNPDDGGIGFFALSVGNPDASRVLSLATAAVVARRRVNIFYDPTDLSGPAIGCGNGNCRLIQAIGLPRD